MDRILVVDDSALLHTMLRSILGRMPGCSLSFASNGLEALESLGREGEPSLILLDINMPVMDGLELMSELKATGTLDRVPVVIVSTEGEDEDILRGLEAGARAYLRKPFTPRELCDMIRKVMDR